MRNLAFWRQKETREETASQEETAIQEAPQEEETRESLQKALAAQSEEMKKISRMQYKMRQELLQKLHGLESRGSQESGDQAMLSCPPIKGIIPILLAWLDDLDRVQAGLTQDDGNWNSILDHWIGQVKEMLQFMGLQEMKVLGLRFDPRRAKSLGNIGAEEYFARFAHEGFPLQEYLMVDVIKRGFINEQGHVIRKAEVMTLKEGIHESQ